jgi:hypothetical protein
VGEVSRLRNVEYVLVAGAAPDVERALAHRAPSLVQS